MSAAVTRRVADRVAAVRGRVAARWRAMLPGSVVEEREDGVEIRGRGVARRWIDDPSLTWWRQ